MNTRPTAPGPSRDTEEDGVHDSNEHRPGVLDHQTGQEPAAAAESSFTRSFGKISSMEVLLHYSLSIKIEDLPEKDRGTSAAKTIISLPNPRPTHGAYAL